MVAFCVTRNQVGLRLNNTDKLNVATVLGARNKPGRMVVRQAENSKADGAFRLVGAGQTYRR